MKKIVMCFLLAVSCAVPHQVSREVKEIELFQHKLNKEYKDRNESPLRGAYFDGFTEHPFFPIDLKYRVNADFERIQDAEPFEMPTSSGRTKTYEAYGKASFQIEGEVFSLIVYQSHRLREMEAYKNHLFLPFYDETNGNETYAGGRYIDLSIPETDQLVIDFNQAYQPYCAYNIYDYSCPIVPSENRLNIRIPAGVMYDSATFSHE